MKYYRSVFMSKMSKGALIGIWILVLGISVPPFAVQSRFAVRQEVPTESEIYIQIKANVQQATVSIDDQVIGYTPVTNIVVTKGLHLIRVDKEGYHPYTQQIDCRPGKPIVVFAELEQVETIRYTLAVNTYPPDATVKIADKPISYYRNIALEPGNYLIEVSADTYQKKEKWVTLNRNMRIAVTLEPELTAKTGLLSVGSNVPGAKVYVDGRKIGIAPFVKARIMPGEHHVLVAYSGYQTFQKKINFKVDQHVRLNADLLPDKKARLYIKVIPASAEIKFIGEYFRFSQGIELSYGDYLIEISAPGHITQTLSVTIGSELDKKIEVYLKKRNAEIQRRAEQFEFSENGILYDSLTNLEWYVGDENLSWYYAGAWASELSAFGGGWRLPTLYEVERICSNPKGKKALETIIGINGRHIWVSNIRGLHQAWAYDYESQNAVYFYKEYARECLSVAVRNRKLY